MNLLSPEGLRNRDLSVTYVYSLTLALTLDSDKADPAEPVSIDRQSGSHVCRVRNHYEVGSARCTVDCSYCSTQNRVIGALHVT